MREHRKLTLLLNVLLAGTTSFQLRRSEGCWALVPSDANPFNVEWVKPYFFAKLGTLVIDALSPPAGEQLEEVEPEEYYTEVGHDGKGLRVPADLDQSICFYLQLSATNRAKFDRATFWIDLAWRQWTISASASFASLVSAVESLTDRGRGATKGCRAFLNKYAPGESLRSHRNKMYKLRSDILHGSDLMQLDQDLAFGWDPPWLNQRELHKELWSLTRTALRNWLKNQPKT